MYVAKIVFIFNSIIIWEIETPDGAIKSRPAFYVEIVKLTIVCQIASFLNFHFINILVANSN